MVAAGTREALPGRSGLAVLVEERCLVTGEEPGNRRGAGRESEAVVVPVEPQDNTTTYPIACAAALTRHTGSERHFGAPETGKR
jgi:hypothetical protein